MKPAVAQSPWRTLIPPATVAVPIVVHVPHASVVIPPAIRAELRLDDAALTAELGRLTDWRVDELFAPLAGLGASLFVNQLSRLVFDPERFTDDANEPAAVCGQGVVYTHTVGGQVLRQISPAARAARIAALYVPYHAALTELVADSLTRFGRCLILDCHSFPRQLPPTALDRNRVPPDICLGTDSFHTPKGLVRELKQRLVAAGFAVKCDSPFAGALVPLPYYQLDRRVSSLMIEVRRDLYCDEANGAPTGDFATVSAKIVSALQAVLGLTPPSFG